jgi:hypothetical protein
MTETEKLLKSVLREHGIGSSDAFAFRYGVTFGTLNPSEALSLMEKRDRYVRGCLLAMETLRGRLECGLAVMQEHPTLAAELRWFRLAERSIRLIAKMSAADRQAGDDFLDSDLGEWYYELRWPTPSPEALAASLEPP